MFFECIAWIYFFISRNNIEAIETEGTQICKNTFLYQTIQVECNSLPTELEWKDITPNATHLLIDCMKSNSMVKPQKRSEIIIPQLSRLVYFSIKNCYISEIRSRTFKDFENLQHVILGNLSVAELPSNLFINTPNLRELTLFGLNKLERVNPGFLGHQTQLQKLHIIECKMEIYQVQPILHSAYATISDFHWRSNIISLYITPLYFRFFQFNNLILEDNGIQSVDFLEHLTTKVLSLKYNPLNYNEKINLRKYSRLCKTLKSLDLEETGLDGSFPDIDYDNFFPKLEELILKNNYIAKISENIDRSMPMLRVLDIRNNRLTGIPQSMAYILKIKSGKLLTEDNPFHCNCELSWVKMFYPKQADKISCLTVSSEKVSVKIQRSLSDLSELICTPPTVKLQITGELDSQDIYKVNTRAGKEIYQMDLYPSDETNWKCIGYGDPAPNLQWLLNDFTLKAESQPVNKQDTITVMKNLIVSHRMMKSNNVPKVEYICRAHSIGGKSEVKLEILIKNGTRVAVMNPLIGKIVQNSKKLSEQLYFSMTTIICILLISQIFL